MKKGRIAVWDQIGGRAAAALLVNGKLDDLLIDPQENTPLVGAFYRAKAGRPMKGQGGIILELGGGQRGYLRGAKGIAPGDMLTVQISSYAEAGKASPASPRLTFKGAFAIVTPEVRGYNIARSIRDDDLREELAALANAAMADAPEDWGLIIRSGAATADPLAVEDEVQSLLALALGITGEDSTEPSLLFEPDAHSASLAAWSSPPPDQLEQGEAAFERLGVFDHIETLKTGAFALPSGGSFYVEPTRALVAVDVNTGRDMSLQAGLKANMELADALPRALRLLGLGGQIVLDLAPQPKKDRRVFEDRLKRNFRTDAVETTLVGWTPLGHYELQRKRERLPLSETCP